MLKPVFILNRHFVAIANSLQSNKTSVKLPLFFRRQYILFSDQSANQWASETMSAKDKKKPKLSESESASSSASSDSDSPPTPPPRKDAKTKSKSKPATDAAEQSPKGKTNSRRVEGEKEPTWELGSQKFITIGDFKGKTYINIREYYTDQKSGDVRPGKKGIGLNIEQWQNLCSSIDEVNKVLKK